ncbi:MAG: glycosyltransferase family 39 protein [bacterium]
MQSNKSAIFAKLLILLIVIGFSARLICMIVLKSYVDPQAWEYGDIAENIVEGRGFSRINEFSHTIENTSSHAPLYPYFLSFFYQFGQKNSVYLIIQLIQILVSALTIWIIYKTTLLLFNRLSAIIAALGASLYPPLIYYSTKLTPTVWTVFFMSLTIFFILKLKNNSLGTTFLCGLTMGLSILTNPIAFAFFPALIIWYLVKKPVEFRKLCLLILVTLVVLVPWTIRNHKIHHRLVPVTTQFCKNLWIGNNPNATGTDYYRVVHDSNPHFVLMTSTLSRKIKDKLGRKTEIERSDYFITQGLIFIVQNPTKFMNLLFTKAFYFWWFAPPEINGSVDAIKYRVINTMIYGPLLVLGIIGIILSLSHNYIKQSLVILLVLIIISATYIFTHVGLARYRMPVETILLIFASLSVNEFKGYFIKKQL